MWCGVQCGPSRYTSPLGDETGLVVWGVEDTSGEVTHEVREVRYHLLMDRLLTSEKGLRRRKRTDLYSERRLVYEGDLGGRIIRSQTGEGR